MKEMNSTIGQGQIQALLLMEIESTRDLQIKQ